MQPIAAIIAPIAPIAQHFALQAEQDAALRAIPQTIWQTLRNAGATYECDDQVGHNLHANEIRVLNYLGAYLPRTVFEVQTIFAELFAVPGTLADIPKNRPLRVLDIGSGTGGAWLGLLHTLSVKTAARAVEIHAVDGNSIALEQQDKFVPGCERELGLNIALHTHQQIFATNALSYAQQLQDCVRDIGGQFDFILISKHLNELYRSDLHAAQGSIAAAAKVLSHALAKAGYLLLLEVTDKIDGGEYLPTLLNRELADYETQPDAILQTVLPVPCAQYAHRACDASSERGCYTQRQLSVPFENGNKTSKVTYRVFARKATGLTATRYAPAAAYRVSATSHKARCAGGKRGNLQGDEANGWKPMLRFLYTPN